MHFKTGCGGNHGLIKALHVFKDTTRVFAGVTSSLQIQGAMRAFIGVTYIKRLSHTLKDMNNDAAQVLFRKSTFD